MSGISKRGFEVIMGFPHDHWIGGHFVDQFEIWRVSHFPTKWEKKKKNFCLSNFPQISHTCFKFKSLAKVVLTFGFEKTPPNKSTPKKITHKYNKKYILLVPGTNLIF